VSLARPALPGQAGCLGGCVDVEMRRERDASAAPVEGLAVLGAVQAVAQVQQRSHLSHLRRLQPGPLGAMLCCAHLACFPVQVA